MNNKSNAKDCTMHEPFSVSDCKKVKKQWKELIVGSLDPDVVHCSEYVTRVDKISNSCKNAWESYKSSVSSDGSIFGIKVRCDHSAEGKPDCGACAGQIISIYAKILDMAKGYGTVGTAYYQNGELASDIAQALEFCYDNYYSVTTLEDGRGAVYGKYYKWDIGATSANWFFRDIHIPLNLTKTLLIMEDFLGKDLASKYAEPISVNWYHDYNEATANGTNTNTAGGRMYYKAMANACWYGQVVLASALIREDSDDISKVKTVLIDMFKYVDKKTDSDIQNLPGDLKTDGFYSDGSFIQHGKNAYTGGYGMAIIGLFTDIMIVLNGTNLAFNEDDIKMHYNVIFDSYLPVNYKGKLFASLTGREVTRTGASEIAKNTNFVISMIKMASYASAEYKSKLESLIKYNMLITGMRYETRPELPLSLIDYTLDIFNNNSIIPIEYKGAHVFGAMDRIVQHNPEYGICVALNSTRIYKYEGFSGDNPTGWYQSDGAIYLYTDDYTYTPSYFKQMNPHKVVGTTVIEKEVEPVYSETRVKNASPFAGGVESADKKYAMSVFDLKYGESDYPSVNKNGYFKPSILAHKSFFMFDNEIVAVGSGISKGIDEYGDLNIYTTVENRLWRADDVFSADGKPTEVGEKSTVTANALHFTNMGGYVFFDKTNVNCKKYANDDSYLELWIDHGINGSGNSKYAYVYLPKATVSETNAYSNSPDVEILAQTDNIHVVREKTLGITGYAFYSEGSANGVTVSNRCALMIEEKDGEYTVTVSDPSHELSNLTVTLDIGTPLSQVVSGCSEASVSFNEKSATISLSIDKNIGQTYTVTLK